MKLTGWSVPTIEDTPAVTLDWLLAIDGTVTRLENGNA